MPSISTADIRIPPLTTTTGKKTAGLLGMRWLRLRDGLWYKIAIRRLRRVTFTEAIEELKKGFWPEDEDVEDFIDACKDRRSEDDEG